MFIETNEGKIQDISYFKPSSYKVNLLSRGKAVCYLGYRMDLRPDSEKSPVLDPSICNSMRVFSEKQKLYF